MQALDDVDWGDADGGDEEFGARVDDYGDEFVEFPLCVIVAGESLGSAIALWLQVLKVGWAGPIYFVFLALPPTCGIKRSTPNGAFLSFKKPFSSAICSRSISGV